MSVPRPSFRHLARLTTDVGLYEHARATTPRAEHGYCTDDVARALVVVVRSPWRARLRRLEAVFAAFVRSAQRADGTFHNRMSADGRWRDEVGSDDAHARALQAAAACAVHAGSVEEREEWLRVFRRGSVLDSPHPRACAGAVLAASDLIHGGARCPEAVQLVERLVPRLGAAPADPAWRWAEPRLSWGNALVPDALLAAGAALGDGSIVRDGLCRLEWLAHTESVPGTFSFTPTGGWAIGEPRPAFDQQPIEAAVMATACERAHLLTGDLAWARRLALLVAWFEGANDVGVRLADPVTGGCCDGLEAHGRNENQGAESTIAWHATVQAASRAALVGAGDAQAAEATGSAAVSSVSRRAATSARPSAIAAPTHRSAAPYVR